MYFYKDEFAKGIIDTTRHIIYCIINQYREALYYEYALNTHLLFENQKYIPTGGPTDDTDIFLKRGHRVKHYSSQFITVSHKIRKLIKTFFIILLWLQWDILFFVTCVTNSNCDYRSHTCTHGIQQKYITPNVISWLGNSFLQIRLLTFGVKTFRNKQSSPPVGVLRSPYSISGNLCWGHSVGTLVASSTPLQDCTGVGSWKQFIVSVINYQTTCSSSSSFLFIYFIYHNHKN